MILKSQTHNFRPPAAPKNCFALGNHHFFRLRRAVFFQIFFKDFPRNGTFVLLSARIRAFLATNGRRTRIFFLSASSLTLKITERESKTREIWQSDGAQIFLGVVMMFLMRKKRGTSRFHHLVVVKFWFK